MRRYVTGSRRGDLLAFSLLACLLAAGAFYRLRVYYQVTLAELTVIRVGPDGARQVMPTPDEFQRIGSAGNAEITLLSLDHQIREYVLRNPPDPQAGPEIRYEWIVRYSMNSDRLDQQHVLVFDGNGVEAP